MLIEIELSHAEPIRLVPEELEVVSNATITVRDTLSDGAFYEIELAYDATLERFAADSVMVRRSGEGSDVTSRLIREVTIQEIISSVVLRDLTTVYNIDEDGPYGKMNGQQALDRVRPAAGRDNYAVRVDAALVSTLAKLASRPPLVTVAAHLEVSHSTAKRLLAAGVSVNPRG